MEVDSIFHKIPKTTNTNSSINALCINIILKYKARVRRREAVTVRIVFIRQRHKPVALWYCSANEEAKQDGAG